jgi:putative hydrolase of the HAD superfamily
MSGLVLFDLDNTLLDRDAAFARWARLFMAAHDLPIEVWSIIKLADKDGRTTRNRFFVEICEPLNISTPVEELLVHYYVDYPACYSIESATVTALRRLRALGWKVGVVTNGESTQRKKMEATYLENECDAVCVSEELGCRKPDIRIFEAAADLCGLPLDGWMIGDSPEADIAGGIAAGLRTVWMSRGRVWNDSSHAPEFTVSSIPEAAEIIVRFG